MGNMTVIWTPKQQEAMRLLSGPATHILLRGGSRSGKTFLIVRSIVMRALKAPNSRHGIFRFRFSHCKQSIVLGTFPDVMTKCFPDVQYHIDKTDWYCKLPNGSEIWFGGLDDKDRVEKVLGKEFVTLFLNECSQISNDGREMVITRLAQLVQQVIQGKANKPLKPRIFYDWNPSSKSHWGYKIFQLLTNPDTGKPIANPQDYATMAINPVDNAENLSAGYIQTLQGLSAAKRKRFLDGEAADATPGALFDDIVIDKWRITDEPLPQMVRVVVGIDPSGADEESSGNDAIGIICAGLGIDGKAYVLEDCTVIAGPAVWGRVAVECYERNEADLIVGESNYGGGMVRHVIQTVPRNGRMKVVFKLVTATRGKHIRAEPFSALYEQGRVVHVGHFPELEAEQCDFNTTGYTGSKSPNRADALFWALAELFGGIVKEKALPPRSQGGNASGQSFMAN